MEDAGCVMSEQSSLKMCSISDINRPCCSVCVMRSRAHPYVEVHYEIIGTRFIHSCRLGVQDEQVRRRPLARQNATVFAVLTLITFQSVAELTMLFTFHNGICRPQILTDQHGRVNAPYKRALSNCIGISKDHFRLSANIIPSQL